MTTAKAFTAAIKFFEKDRKDADLRTVSMWECTGANGKYSSILFHIEYAVCGDYTESDREEYLVFVTERDGKVVAEKR